MSLPSAPRRQPTHLPQLPQLSTSSPPLTPSSPASLPTPDSLASATSRPFSPNLTPQSLDSSQRDIWLSSHSEGSTSEARTLRGVEIEQRYSVEDEAWKQSSDPSLDEPPPSAALSNLSSVLDIRPSFPAAPHSQSPLRPRQPTQTTYGGSLDMSMSDQDLGTGSADERVREKRSTDPLVAQVVKGEKATEVELTREERHKQPRMSFDAVRHRLSGGANGVSSGGAARTRGTSPPSYSYSRNYTEKPISSSSCAIHPPPMIGSTQREPSLRALPLYSPMGRRLKNYAQHLGNNRFCVGGRLMMSKDSMSPFVASCALALAIPAAWGIVEGPWTWEQGVGGEIVVVLFGYLCGIMWSSLFMTALRDPGILPRGLDPDPETEWVAPADGGVGEEKVKLRWVRVRSRWVATKWCETCGTYRPPRTSHCRLCNNCVELSDHHCFFVSACIGRRNYLHFLAFLLSTTLALAIVIGSCVARLVVRWRWSGVRGEGGVGSIVVGSVGLVLVGPIGGLALFHLRLVAKNRTTIETLRPKSSQKEQSALHTLGGWRRNCVAVLCRPVGVASYVDFRSWAARDGRQPGGKLS